VTGTSPAAGAGGTDLPTAPARTVRGWSFRFLWAGQSVSVVGDGLAVLGVPLLVLSLSHNPIWAALSATPRTVGYLLAGLFAGAVVDRADSRTTMIVADLLRMLIFAALAVLAATHHISVAVVLIAAFAAAVVAVFFATAYTVLVGDLLDAGQLVKGNARLEFSAQVGALAGPALVGILAPVIGLPAVMAVNAATFTVSIGSLLAIRRGPATMVSGTAAAPLRDRVVEGIRYVWRTPALRGLVGLQSAVNLLIGAETLVVFFVTQTLHAGAAAAGLVVAAGGAGGVAGAALADRLPVRSTRTAIAGAVAVIGLALAGIAVAPNFAVVAVFTAVLGAAGVFGTVHIRAVRQRIVPREILGRVTSSIGMLALMGGPIGAAVSGVAAGALGTPRPVLLLAGLLGLLCAGVGHLYWLRQLPAVAPAESVPR
jgi:MFS family permease